MNDQHQVYGVLVRAVSGPFKGEVRWIKGESGKTRIFSTHAAASSASEELSSFKEMFEVRVIHVPPGPAGYEDLLGEIMVSLRASSDYDIHRRSFLLQFTSRRNGKKFIVMVHELEERN